MQNNKFSDVSNESLSYDYIIAGSGCAGLSLAVQLANSSLNFKRVLIVDRELKNQNDRTWCFWTKEKNNWFDPLIAHSWNKFSILNERETLSPDLNPYAYCLIRGIDFYTYCMDKIKSDHRFIFKIETILSLATTHSTAILETNTNTYKANYIFNSAFRNLSVEKDEVNYIQHFKGWMIESNKESFDTLHPTFMDFSIDQENDCRFVYVLPFSSTKALIEYTGFSESQLSEAAYELRLKSYIENKLKITEYEITETENGVIPMTEGRFNNSFGERVINIGTAGGASKPSSGYTFYFIQKQSQRIIERLLNGSSLNNSFERKKRFYFYDKTLLNVIDYKGIPAKDVFFNLFKNNKTIDILDFLNEESHLWQEIKIMFSVNKSQFVKAILRNWF